MGWKLTSGTLSARAYLTDRYTNSTMGNWYAEGTADISPGSTFTASASITTISGPVAATATISPTSKTVSSPKDGDTVTFTLTVTARPTSEYQGEYLSGTSTKYITYQYTSSSSGGDSGGNEGSTTTGKCPKCGSDLKSNGTCSDIFCSYGQENVGNTEYRNFSASDSGLKIIDNYNNTFTIKAKTYYENSTYGVYDTSPIDSDYGKLRYGFTQGDYSTSTTRSAQNYPNVCTDITDTEDSSGKSWTSGLGYVPDQTAGTEEVTVYAKGWWKPYLSTDDNYYGHVSKTSGTVKYYAAPVFPTDATPTITTTSGKLTLKEPWILSWSEAMKSNDTSPVKGYGIKLINTDTNQSMRLVSAETNEPLSNIEDDYYLIDTLNLKIDPKESGIQANQSYKLSICAFTRFGLDNTGDILKSNYIESDSYIAKNNGVLYVKVNGEWQEGQVYMKVPVIDSQGSIIGSSWAEAEAVYTRNADGEWEESTSL